MICLWIRCEFELLLGGAVNGFNPRTTGAKLELPAVSLPGTNKRLRLPGTSVGGTL